jgi:hypothetical protein
MPFSLEYWHMGETKMRLWNSTERRTSGEKRWEVIKR